MALRRRVTGRDRRKTGPPENRNAEPRKENQTNRRKTNMAKKDESQAIDKAPQASAVVERNPADASTYRILNRTEEELNRTMDVFHHNLRGQKLTELNLPRAKVPPRG